MVIGSIITFVNKHYKPKYLYMIDVIVMIM